MPKDNFLDQADKQKIRILTTTSLFDGHDAAINIMRRIMQQSGAEVIEGFGSDYERYH